uniref:Cilia- and flagella-associated protein 300 n=1 Tax=Amphiprion percula TaxID=161767 RepID=A0A3P8T694_AMPPE
MAAEKCPFEQTFSFSPLPTKKFSFLQDKDTLALLMKWSMLGRISAQCYSFDLSFSSYNSEKFALPDHVWNVFLCVAEKPVVSVSVESVPCTQVSMELFDPIYSCGVVKPSGRVVKCFHDVHPDYDELRQVTLRSVCLSKQRAEFLFRVFKHLCVGGELCQYEDTIDPYINTTKQMYKDLISVQKDPETKKISVVSTVLKVCAYDESGPCYPTQEEDQTFAYLIVDPFRRHVTLFSHFYGLGNFAL